MTAIDHGDVDLGPLLRSVIRSLKPGDHLSIEREYEPRSPGTSRLYLVRVFDFHETSTPKICGRGESIADAVAELAIILTNRSRASLDDRAKHAWDGWTKEDIAEEMRPWPKDDK